MRPADADAKYNRDLVQKRLDELQKQQHQQQNQNQQKNQNDKNNQQNKQNQQDKQNQQGGQQNRRVSRGNRTSRISTVSPTRKISRNRRISRTSRISRISRERGNPQPAGPTQADPGQPAGHATHRTAAAASRTLASQDRCRRLKRKQLLDSAQG